MAAQAQAPAQAQAQAQAQARSSTPVRVLPVAEWEKLRTVPPFDVIPLSFNPDTDQVVVAEDSTGQIVAYWCVFTTVHIEPMWIAEEHRGRVGLIRRLWGAVRGVLADMGVDVAFALIRPANPAAEYAKRLGFARTAGDSYFVSMRGAAPEINKLIAEYARAALAESGGGPT